MTVPDERAPNPKPHSMKARITNPAEQVAAANVDPNTIIARASFGTGVELLSRTRPPASIELGAGHREHLLMCTTGTPVHGHPVTSKLTTNGTERTWQTCPRDLVTFVPAGLRLQWSWSYSSRSIHIVMPAEYLNSILTQVRCLDDESPDLSPVFRVPHPTLSLLTHQLQEETGHQQLGSDLITSSLLTLIGVQVVRMTSAGAHALDKTTSAPPPSPSNAVRHAMEVLNDRVAENVSLDELASEHHYSPWHFARLFKQAIGMPPHRYQLQLRITRSLPLLTERPKRSVAEIAAELGFADESHFRRHFKRIMGTTPGTYRQKQ
jgi:AraC family transcriptional regulator